MHRAVIVLGLSLGAGAFAIATSAQAYQPDLEKCHYETKCHTVTPACPPGQYHKPRPCQGPYQVCKQVKVCPGD